MSTRALGALAGAVAFVAAIVQYANRGDVSYPLIVSGILAIVWFGFLRSDTK